MTVDEMMKLLDDALETTRPLYDAAPLLGPVRRWPRATSAPRRRLIPAHWIGNRWAQTWPGLVEAANLDPLFKGATAESIVKSAENFYVSLGFPKLPDDVLGELGPLPGPARRRRARRTRHASAWDIDRAGDVRSLMSVEPNRNGSTPPTTSSGTSITSCPTTGRRCRYLLRDGANRAFHEAIGELAKLASQQTPYLVKVGVMPHGEASRTRPAGCCSSALDSIVFLPFSAGTMSHFEHDLYEDELPPAEWQQRWWDYVAQLPGRRAAGREPRGGSLRRLHQDPHQRRRRAVLRLRAGDA